MKKHYFKVKYGYSTSDQVSIPFNELEKAIYAQIKGVPVQLGNAYVNGRNIISITPHYHKHTGWYDYYEPQSGEDWEQIKRDCPNYDGIIENTKERVSFLVQSGKENLIGKNAEIPQLDNKGIPKEISEGVKQIADIMKIK